MYKRIVVAIDGSESSTAALTEALRVARAEQSRLRVIHVIDLGSLLVTGAEGIDLDRLEEAWCATGRRVLEQAGETTKAAAVDAEMALLESSGALRVSDVIAADAASWQADLLVVGTRGRHGISHFLLGSVAEGVARTATMPVLLVRHP